MRAHSCGCSSASARDSRRCQVTNSPSAPRVSLTPTTRSGGLRASATASAVARAESTPSRSTSRPSTPSTRSAICHRPAERSASSACARRSRRRAKFTHQTRRRLDGCPGGAARPARSARASAARNSSLCCRKCPPKVCWTRRSAASSRPSGRVSKEERAGASEMLVLPRGRSGGGAQRRGTCRRRSRPRRARPRVSSADCAAQPGGTRRTSPGRWTASRKGVPTGGEQNRQSKSWGGPHPGGKQRQRRAPISSPC
mmetsp:Transcript_101764/g.317971  ORF Transcript_101764/g.317971 Transcript_101764/m.317971 type:complete len:256 (-) Transcript_101764:159-926(-)